MLMVKKHAQPHACVLWIASIISVCNGEYYCWEESERVILKFINNPNRTITHLPTVRLIQGYYPSQFAMQYAAYVYLKEKMGVDVQFYPDNDPDALFNRYSGYTEWCMDSNVTGCSAYAPYPQFYFEDIKQNEYDLLFETWDIALRDGNGYDYIEHDHVTHGGISGVYGEGGWFIPKYVYDNHPEWILPHTLKYNESVRQLFIDAYTVSSDRNYIDTWWSAYNEDNITLTQYIAMGYGVPTESVPIIFGSNAQYAISKYSGELVNHLLSDGINWTFVAFGAEGNLTDFIVDLYSKELPFIANLYSPHKDFATTLPNTTGYMQFERIALPRNPNNDVTDVCYEAAQCTFPIGPLLKMGNPVLLSQFDEMKAFLIDFGMTSNDVNDIIAYHTETQNYNLTKHESWINATCKWMQQNKNVTNDWHQNITRYDCISGCGFNYYYTTMYDAVTESNALSTVIGDSIAGSCTYNSVEPQCHCPSEFFIGQTCRNSCPGVIGPMLSRVDNRSSLSMLVVGNYTLYLCSGNGDCDIKHKRCDCFPGYGGDACDIVYQEFQYETGFVILWCVLFVIVIVVLIASGMWLYCNKHYKTIRALSPNLTMLFTLGLVLLCCSSILNLFHPLTDVLCSARICFRGIGAILTIMAPLCKTYRVALIFAQARNLKRIVIPDKKLLVYLIQAVIVESVICLIYTVLHQINGGVEKIYIEEYQRTEYKCNQSVISVYIQAANYFYIFALIMILCFFSFKNRSTHHVFKESRCAFFGSFFTLFVFLVVFIFDIVVNDMSVIITIQSGATFISVCVVWGLFYGVRMYGFFMFPEDRSVVELTPKHKRSSTRRQTTHVSIMESMESPETQRSKRDSQGMPGYIHELYDQRGMGAASPTKQQHIRLIPPSSAKNNKIQPIAQQKET